MLTRPRKIDASLKDFPELLKNIPNPPDFIFAYGDCRILHKPTVAIVGTRKATAEGLKFSEKIAEILADLDFTIVSGLAFGIDAAAHEGALRSGSGGTAAVLAHGLDMVYPKEHERLAEKILSKNGVLVSEYPNGTVPFPNHFLERNRIIAGLCAFTIVVEAPERSGALVTARHAIEAGREVFVLPGLYYNRNYAGSHSLIRNGARLVGSTDDILEDIKGISGNFFQSLKDYPENSQKEKKIASEEEEKILEAIRRAPVSPNLDTLIEMTKLEPRLAAKTVAFMTLQGKISENQGKFVII